MLATHSGPPLVTFDDLVAGIDPAVAAIARRLRAVILAVHPDAVEVVRLGDHAASYGVGPKKMREAHSYIMPKHGYVNLGFYRGAQLANPDGLIEGSGTLLRHVKVRSLADAERPVLGALIAAALVEHRRALGISDTG